MKHNIGKWLLAAGMVGWLGRKALHRRRQVDLKDKVVLITGGSRGLGYLLAREFAAAGCRLSICARDEAELERARQDLAGRGAKVLVTRCDVTQPDQVEHWVDEALRHYGRIDILVNNAGTIQVGPVETMTRVEFEQALAVIFWGTFHPIWAVLPQLRRQKQGQIVNITSIGGKVSVPHLLPYTVAKAAALRLSAGLRAELRQHGISVTTVAPGLMRTGAHLNSYFKGRHSDEYTWFALGASAPFLAMGAERAARQIVTATRNREAEIILSLPANLLARLHGLFPGLTTDVMGLTARLLLPSANGASNGAARGMAVQRQLSPARRRIIEPLTVLGTRAARRFHQYPGPVSVLDINNTTGLSER